MFPMATIDTDLYDALKAVNVPEDKARAAAASLERRLSETKVDLVTSVDLGAAVDRLDNKIDAAVDRLESQIKSLDSLMQVQFTMIKWLMGLQAAATLGILWTVLRLAR